LKSTRHVVFGPAGLRKLERLHLYESTRFVEGDLERSLASLASATSA
jgi:hypothetical protein